MQHYSLQYVEAKMFQLFNVHGDEVINSRWGQDRNNPRTRSALATGDTRNTLWATLYFFLTSGELRDYRPPTSWALLTSLMRCCWKATITITSALFVLKSI